MERGELTVELAHMLTYIVLWKTQAHIVWAILTYPITPVSRLTQICEFRSTMFTKSWMG